MRCGVGRPCFPILILMALKKRKKKNISHMIVCAEEADRAETRNEDSDGSGSALATEETAGAEMAKGYGI